MKFTTISDYELAFIRLECNMIWRGFSEQEKQFQRYRLQYASM